MIVLQWRKINFLEILYYTEIPRYHRQSHFPGFTNSNQGNLQ